ncbi:MAG TPA: selenocysteine-specific translation elongation factor [Terracidiphilus sp.]|nr:selenocysteine-specific translation elongation factor [Terracidiphilus sp.]
MIASSPQSAKLPAADIRHVIVGTAGHIDHGKTALVYALTGTDTDRLPEEKLRGITIDLGFASLELHHPQHGALHLSLIDVPGHHAFIRNMLAGTGGIDCVMLIIAADEGVKAQTEEHLSICSLLGIERGVVVLSKCDAVREDHLSATRESVANFLEHTFLANAPVIAVSALRGDGIPELKSALAAMAANVPERSNEQVLRLPLDRAFSMRGFGTVVTGTLHAGTVHSGDTLEQHPQGRALRVRGLQVHGEKRESTKAPCRVALNLAGVEVAEVSRGDTLTFPRALTPARTIDVELSMLPDAPPLRHGSRVRIHAFTFEALAKILFFDQKNSAESGSSLARLHLAKPLLLVPGDRFVLRRCSPALTAGGGRVLDSSTPPGVRKSASLAWLKELRSAEIAEQLRLRVARRGAEGLTLDALVAETGLTAAALRRRIAPLAAIGRLVECAANKAANSHWITTESLGKAVAAVELELESAGTLNLAELRFRARLGAPVFDTVLQRLSACGKLVIAGDLVQAPGRGDAIPEAMRRQMDSIERFYEKAGLASPLLSEVKTRLGAASIGTHEAITHLLRAKRLVRMGADDTFVHPHALDKLYADLRRHRGEMFDVGRFKSFTGLTRKHAIPLLEHLDQARITRNNGGTRIVL